MQQAVTQAIAGLSERKVQFTYTDVLARTVGILPPENGVIERARAGIDEAISREQLIPLDREKGLFTSGIHVLDELSVRALSRDIMKQNRVTVHPEKSVPPDGRLQRCGQCSGTGPSVAGYCVRAGRCSRAA